MRTSTDPKMREALRRFYGANAPTPMKDTSRTIARTLPKQSIPMGKSVQVKPSQTSMGSRTGGRLPVNTRLTISAAS